MEEFNFDNKIVDLFLRDENKCAIGFKKENGIVFMKGDTLCSKLFKNDKVNPLVQLIKSEMFDDANCIVLGRLIAEAMSIVDEEYEYYRNIKLNAVIDGKNRVMKLIVLAAKDGYTAIISLDKSGDVLSAPEDTRHNAPFPVREVERMISENENRFAIIQFDINSFKLINQKYGDTFGDEVLKHISTYLAKRETSSFLGSRFGADIFTIFVTYDNECEVYCLINEIRNDLSIYKNVKMSLAFGAYFAKDKNIPLRVMTDCVAIARKKNKGKYNEDVNVFDKNDADKLNSIKEIENDMVSALENGEFQVYLQPKCNINSGKIIGAEALVRWIHPKKGIISPGDFIPIFEQNGFIETLDMYVCKVTCKIIKGWIENGKEPVPISFNLSRVYLGKDGLVDKINDIVSEYNIPKNLIEVEITETYENAQADQCIEQLRENGYTLLMDDFGSGYSSLNTLRKDQFDVIKFDRGFLGDSMLSEKGKKIISHTINMTRDIGMEIIAEGVETDVQAEFLLNSGCEQAQGFLYSKPVPIQVFENKLFASSASAQ